MIEKSLQMSLLEFKQYEQDFKSKVNKQSIRTHKKNTTEQNISKRIRNSSKCKVIKIMIEKSISPIVLQIKTTIT